MALVPSRIRLAASIALVVLAVAALRVVPHAADAPRRIISLVPATTEMLFVMGAGDRLAGVSNYDRFPPDVARLPKVGGLLDPDVERLLSLKPDLVIVYDTQTDLKRQLERARIPIFPYVDRGLPARRLEVLGDRGRRVADGGSALRDGEVAAAVTDLGWDILAVGVAGLLHRCPIMA